MDFALGGMHVNKIKTNGSPGSFIKLGPDGEFVEGAVVGVGNLADNETPGGTIDGVNTDFTLAHAPNPTASLQLQLGGIFLTQGVDYTISGNTITFLTAPDASLSGQPFKAFYRYA
jgi:hypothetical protein